MADSAREFFERASEQFDGAGTVGERASYRFDITGAGSWHVDVNDGRVTIAESDESADCVLSMSEQTFLKLTRGEANPMTVYMTGKLKVDGDQALALKLKDFFF